MSSSDMFPDELVQQLVRDSAARKLEPVHSGNYAYFPRAHRAVSRLSRAGSIKHHPTKPMHWAKEKSADHPDCLARHAQDPYDIDPDSGELHLTAVTWRALAWLEIVEIAKERGLATPDDLKHGRADIVDLGRRIAELEAKEAAR